MHIMSARLELYITASSVAHDHSSSVVVIRSIRNNSIKQAFHKYHTSHSAI